MRLAPAQDVVARLSKLTRVSALISGVVLLACAGLVLLEIVMRRIGTSIDGTDEISGYVMALVTSWGMAYALTERAHVRIDILRSRAPQRLRAALDLLALFALACAMSFVAICGWTVLERSIVNSSRANTPLATPLVWVQAPWLAGWIWFAVSAWVLFFAAAALVRRGDMAAVEAATGTPHEVETPK